MSEDKFRNGRTMIGTMAPVVPTRTGRPTGHPTPAVTPTGSVAIPVVPPGQSTSPPASVPGLPPNSNALPTVGLGPQGPQLTSNGHAPAPMPLFGEDPLIGQELCGYTIRRKLAEGGMGVVYEGEHLKIGRRGAIKVLKLELCRDEGVVERFRQEARAVNAIQHENIVDIYDFGRDDYGRVFFVMEYLEGEPLSQRIRRAALSWPEAFPILEQTLRALKAAHDKGFVHRDLKPDNIWLKYVDNRVEVKLLDFGIAKLVGSESPREKLTQTGSVIGTPHYMSPEQINGSRDIDQRTDIYALGIIMYEMFAGVTPFVGETLQAIMTGHLFKEPPRLADIPNHLGVPGPIAEIIDRMLVKDAGARYANVNDVLSDIYDINGNRTPTLADTMNRQSPVRGATVVAFAGQPQPKAPAKGGKGKIIAVVAGLGAAAAVAAVVVTQHKAETKTAVVAPTPPVIVDKKVDPPVPPVPPVIDLDAAKVKSQALLRASLKETEPTVRVAGEDALGKIKDQPSVPSLTDLAEHDADDAVKGHGAVALGQIGAGSAKAVLGKLETAATSPGLKVAYAVGLSLLDDAGAKKRLLTYATGKDLPAAYIAGLALADVSKPGETATLKALSALAGKEDKLRELDPLAGIRLLTKAAALHDATARKQLYAYLDNNLEIVQLAAAEGLARIGDDAGKKVLADIAAKAGANQVPAAIAQVALGDYGGIELITHALSDKDPGKRVSAALALGDIGDRKNKIVAALVGLDQDKDWVVRIAAARAIVEIAGIDPLVLAQASVDWTKDALGSDDWAVRRAAAGVLSDLPAKDAMPLLAAAIADKNTDVRLAASRSAGKIKTAEAAEKVAIAVKAETDPKVKEQQVRALGEIGKIGGDAAHDTLTEISAQPGRIGVFAAGSLIAFGDPAGQAKLEQAVAKTQPLALRLAAVEAASGIAAADVVPTLKLGLLDKMFDVQVVAAIGIADHMEEKATAVSILNKAIDTSKDNDIIARAIAALTRFGEPVQNKAKSPAELVESTDPKLRLAAVPAVSQMAPSDGVPLLRRLMADQDQDVRHASVDAIAAVATKDKDQAIRLYKPLVHDVDPVVRSKAAGQLARLVQPVTVTPPKGPDVVVTQDKPPEPPKGPSVELTQALDTAKTAATDADAADTAITSAGKDQAAMITGTEHDDAAIAKVTALAAKARQQSEALDAAVTKLDIAINDATTASATPAQLTEPKARFTKAQNAAKDAHERVAKMVKDAHDFAVVWTADRALLITAAKTSISVGNFADAQQKLAQAGKGLPPGTKYPELDEAYGELYLKKAQPSADPAEKRKLLQQSQTAFQRAAKAGNSSARQGLNDVAEELKTITP